MLPEDVRAAFGIAGLRFGGGHGGSRDLLAEPDVVKESASTTMRDEEDTGGGLVLRVEDRLHLDPALLAGRDAGAARAAVLLHEHHIPRDAVP